MSQFQDQTRWPFQFPRGNLRAAAAAATDQALASGALQPIATRAEVVEEVGVRFLVRLLIGTRGAANLAQKQASRISDADRSVNPFLPYEPAMFVTDISPTHLCLLNKFTVIPDHLLLVTRAFEEQDARLNLADFAALAACLAEFAGLGFYNAGMTAGASQRHKHLQYVALPLGWNDEPVPITPALGLENLDVGMTAAPGLPFLHRLVRLPPRLYTAPLACAQVLLIHYNQMLAELRLENRQNPGPNNLLVTREWLLLVPRVSESSLGIGVNGLGFAGCFLVRNEEALTLLREQGPFALLGAVTTSAASQGASSASFTAAVSDGQVAETKSSRRL